MPKVSVVVPVYQVEAYLPQCIDSIEEQTFQDYELLLVDDGSKDRSGEICDVYALKDKRIRVIHQVNSGVAAARRKGVECARGEWICFVDGDDMLPVDALNTLFRNTERADMVIGKYQVVSPDGKKEENQRFVFREDGWECDHITYLKTVLEGKSPASVCGRIIRKTLLDDDVLTIPRDITMGEDYILCIRLAVKDIRIRNIDEVVYHYIRHTGSATGTFVHSWEYKRQIDFFILPLIEEKQLSQFCNDSIIRHHLRWLYFSITDKDLKYSDPLIRSIRKQKAVRLKVKERVYLKLLIFPPFFRKGILKIYCKLKVLFYGVA